MAIVLPDVHSASSTCDDFRIVNHGFLEALNAHCVFMEVNCII
jgi:hypothetical protein